MNRSHKLRRAALVSATALLVLPMAAQIATAPSQTNGSSVANFTLAASPLSTGGPFRPPAPNCGATIYKSTGAAWKCTFADEFSGTSLDSTKWVPQETAVNGYRAGDGCFVKSANNNSVLNGTLRLTVRKEAAPFTCKNPNGDFTTQYTSGGAMSYGKFAQTYGRFEFRAKFPNVQVAGVHSSLWLYPASDTYGAWPASGEIDVAEFYSSYPDRAIPYLHYNTLQSLSGDGTSGLTNWYCTITDPSAFHTYVGEWTSKGIKIMYDGQTCLDHVWNPAAPLIAPKPFDKPFAMVLTQALGMGSNEFVEGTTPLPATTEIDWVHVWS